MQGVYAKLTNHFSDVFQIQMVSIEKGIKEVPSLEGIEGWVKTKLVPV